MTLLLALVPPLPFVWWLLQMTAMFSRSVSAPRGSRTFRTLSFLWVSRLAKIAGDWIKDDRSNVPDFSDQQFELLDVSLKIEPALSLAVRLDAALYDVDFVWIAAGGNDAGLNGVL